MKRLLNKTVLITGGCGDIGLATAELFIQEGAHVIIADIQDQKGFKLQEKLGLIYKHLDVGNENDWEHFLNEFSSDYEKLDILFNNAGIFGFDEISSIQNPESLSLEDWRYIHQVNLDSVFLGCKFGIQMMKKNGGSIINMSSRAGLIGVPSAAAYASSKAAICNYTKSVALYCAEKSYQIRCNSLHPGIVQTDFWAPILKTEKYTIEDIKTKIPVKNLGTPYDIACAALFLGSDESRYITGTELMVDGGMSAGRIGNPIHAGDNLSTKSVDKVVRKD